MTTGAGSTGRSTVLSLSLGLVGVLSSGSESASKTLPAAAGGELCSSSPSSRQRSDSAAGLLSLHWVVFARTAKAVDRELHAATVLRQRPQCSDAEAQSVASVGIARRTGTWQSTARRRRAPVSGLL